MARRTVMFIFDGPEDDEDEGGEDAAEEDEGEE